MPDSVLNLILRASKTGTGPAEARRELAALNSEIKATHQSAIQSTNAYFSMAQSLKQSSSLATVSKQALGGLNAEMKAGRLDTSAYAAAATQVGLQAKLITPASLQAATAINKLNADYTQGKINAGQYAQGIADVQRKLDASRPFLEKYGAALKGIALAGLGLLVAAFVDAARTAGQFESSMNRIQALTNTTKAEIGGMKDAVLAMSKEVGRGPRELAEGLYFVASSGFAGAQGLKVLEAAAKASAAGLGETKTIADAVTSTLNAYQMGVDQATRVTDVLIQIVKEGKGEPAEFAGSLGRILPIAAAAGVSFEQVGASMAVMTRTGMSAEEAATALRGTLAALEAPGKQAQEALASVGLNADEVRKSIRERGLLATLQDLMVRTKGNVETLDLIIPNIRALTGVLSTAGSQGEAYAEVLRSMSNAAGSTETAFKTASETMEFKLQQTEASFDTLKVAVMEGVLPALKDFFDTMTKGVNTLNLLVTWNDKMGEAVAGVESKLRVSAGTYEEYRAGVLGAALAAGKITQAQKEAYETTGTMVMGMAGWMDITKEVEKQTGVLSETMFEQARAQAAVDQGAKNMAATQDVIQTAMMGTQGTVEDVSKSMEYLEEVQRDLARATAIMTAGYGSAVSNEMDSFGKKNDELRAKAADLAKQIAELEAVQGKQVITGNHAALTANEMAAAQAKLAAVTEDITLKQRKKNETDAEFAARMANLQVQADKLTGKINGVSGAYVDNSEKIGELKEKYAEVNAAIDENVAKHDEAMKRIVLDIAQQQLAQDGWTKTEIEAFTAVAKQMGVFDQASATMTANVLNATGQLASDGNVGRFQENMATAMGQTVRNVKTASDELGGLKRSIDALKSKTVTIKTIYHEQRIIEETNKGQGRTTPLPGGAQFGGVIPATRPTLVGESGPELFWPATRGFVMDNADSARLINALEMLAARGATPAASYGGDTVIINDKLALAQYYEQRRRSLVERHNARMGG